MSRGGWTGGRARTRCTSTFGTATIFNRSEATDFCLTPRRCGDIARYPPVVGRKKLDPPENEDRPIEAMVELR
jgi:hypothetical protein